MKLTLSIILSASLSVATAAADDAPEPQELSAEQVRAEMEGIASRLHFFTADFFQSGMWPTTDFDNPHSRRMREHQKTPITETEEFIRADLETIRPIFWPKFKPDALIPLLEHRDPKVCTLAAAALAAIDPIRYGTAIEPLLDNLAPTFPSLMYYRHDHPSQPKPQTVANATSRFAHRVDPERIARLDAWRAATGRKCTCGELLGQLNRAERARDCYPTESKEKIDAINNEIAQLPLPDRTWYQIAFARRQRFEPGRKPNEFDLDTEGDLVALAGQLTHEQLIGALQRRLDTQDPSVHAPGIKEAAAAPRVLVSISDSIRRFILDHADRLLKPSDIDFLLMREWVEPGYTGLKSPIWAIAAARIEPRRAPEFLLPALDRWSLKLQERERQSIMLALYELSSETPVQSFVDWFYREPCSQNSEADLLGRYLGSVSKMCAPDGRIVIAAIVRDQRFDELPPQIVEEVNLIMDERLGRDHSIKGEWDNLKHPLGKTQFWWRRAGATVEYPAETKQFLDTMAHWRAHLREHVDAYQAVPER